MSTQTEPTVPPTQPQSFAASPQNSATASSVPELVSTLASDISHLITTEMALARAEMQEAANDAKKGVAGMALGGSLAMAGVIILLMAAVYALGLELPLWLAALITGVSAVGVGLFLLQSGQAKIEPGAFVPQRTKSSLEKDKHVAKRSIS